VETVLVCVPNKRELLPPKKIQDLDGLGQNFDSTFTINITSVAVVISTFMTLLHLSLNPKVINISLGMIGS
jgi:hypothetical protein